MKESMMRSQVFVSTLMNKLIIVLPIFLLSMCSDAPVTPPAHACSPRLDGQPTFCPPFDGDLPPKPKISRQEVKGEVDIYNPYHWHTLHGVFVENLRRKRIEENMTSPSDAINSALDDFMEAQYGSNGSTEQEKLL